MESCKQAETDPSSGKIFAYVYNTNSEALQVVREALEMFRRMDPDALPASADQENKAAIVGMFYHAFLAENALNPLIFPSLRKFETETVSMVAGMLHGGAACVGSVTSGGTESILTAVKTYRDRARKLFPSITQPEIVSKTNHFVPYFMSLLTPSCAGGTPHYPPCFRQGCRLLWVENKTCSTEIRLDTRFECLQEGIACDRFTILVLTQ